jgi:hypothetical protein
VISDDIVVVISVATVLSEAIVCVISVEITNVSSACAGRTLRRKKKNERLNSNGIFFK